MADYVNAKCETQSSFKPSFGDLLAQTCQRPFIATFVDVINIFMIWLELVICKNEILDQFTKGRERVDNQIRNHFCLYKYEIGEMWKCPMWQTWWCGIFVCLYSNIPFLRYFEKTQRCLHVFAIVWKSFWADKNVNESHIANLKVTFFGIGLFLVLEEPLANL